MDAGPSDVCNFPEGTSETDTVRGTIFSNSVLFVSPNKNETNSYNYNTPEVIYPPYCEFNKTQHAFSECKFITLFPVVYGNDEVDLDVLITKPCMIYMGRTCKNMKVK